MSSIGSNPVPHAGCGAPPAAMPAMPHPGTLAGVGGGHAFTMPAGPMPMPMPMEPERFVASSSGGLILDKDGAPSGRIAAGSFVDTKDGKVYGPDNKPIVLPEGSSVDFFDLPSIKQLMDDAKQMAAFAATANGSATGSGATTAPGKTIADPGPPPTKTAVDGQWGPGGVTDLKGGGATKPDDGCDSMHGPTGPKGSGGSSHHSTTAGGPTTTKATAATPTSQSALAAQLQAMATQLQSLVGGVSGGGASAAASGAATAATGASHLGTLPGLHASLNDLVATLRQLTDVLASATKGGGIWQLPPPPPKAPPTPAKPTTATPTSTSTTATTAATKTTPSTTSTST
jgi:hypothetical protein